MKKPRAKKSLNMDYEKALSQKGFSFICGVDEVGRGPWAGPIVAVATIIMNHESRILNLPINDSKRLTEARREEIFEIVKDDKNIHHSVAFISAEEIDKIGLGVANHLVLKKAVEGLSQKPDCVLVDSFVINDLGIKQEKIIKGDAKIFSIALASIIAKVSRDRYMRELAKKYPGYGFEQHKGYGTKKHQEAIEKYGICQEHRRSFRPIRDTIIK